MSCFLSESDLSGTTRTVKHMSDTRVHMGPETVGHRKFTKINKLVRLDEQDQAEQLIEQMVRYKS
jgi:hypothetical protein